MSECYSEKLDEILENKKKEIDTIYNRKFEKKILENDDEKKEVLSYDVKKIIGKQKTHENKRLLKSKAHQNKLDMELNDILANTDKL
tara:strand:- start:23337 stop:23597 length:261 start_codon:yes stop_codon:yes gene_type:complete